MATLPTDASDHQALTHDLLNEIGSAVNDISDNLQVLATDNATQSAALTNLQTSVGGTQGNIATAKTTADSQATQISNLQTSAAAAQDRLTVLENHNPPPATPGKPTGLTAGTITTTTVQLSWAAPTGTAPTSYVPRHATPPGSGNWINDPAVTAPTVTTTITGLASATPYDFSVVPANAAGPGVASDTITATTLSVITPSPAWTEMPPATRIVMDDGGVVTLVSGVVFLNGHNMGNTSSVSLVLKSDTGRIYQENSSQNWWYWDPTQTQPWVATSDPRSVVSSGAPAIAAAVGYNQRTFGSSPRTGWFVRDGTAVDQSDGAVRLISADGFNGGYATTLLTGGYMGFTGTSFGGGAYFRITAKWSGAGIGGAGFPQIWTRDVEGETGFNLTSVPIQYPGRPNTSNLWFEEVIAYDNGTNANDFGSTLFLYSTEFAAINGALQRKTFPGGFADRTSYHTYGLLWVPATPSARGYMAYCYDDVEYQRVTWDYRANRSTLPIPPTVTDLGGNVSLINVGSDIDWRHHFPILGSGSTSPLDVLKTEVWQKNTSANIINGQSGGGGGGTTAPAIAAAVGYNTNSFGPDIRVGGTNPNWYILDGTAVQQPDGAWRLISTDGFGGGFGSLKYVGGSFNTITTGVAFGGGLYVRFLARWQGPGGGGTGGWPGLWSNDLEGQTGFTNANSPIHYPPGGPAPSNIWHEFDLMEDPGNFSNDYGSALHVFTTDFGNLQAAISRFTWPNGSTTRMSYHWYGMLWVPATPTTRGYIAYCFDDVEYQRTSWDYRADRNTLPSPPSISTLSANHYLLNTGSEIDSRHLFWLAGSGSASPVDLMSVEVWQKDTTHNLGISPTAPPPTSGNAPVPAAAAGYNTQTLGPAVVMGTNWFKNDNASVVTNNPDGSVTLAGQSNNYNYGILTGDGHSFGTAYGGGMYIEIDCSWINPLNSTHGWPSLWANSVEGRLIPTAPDWPAGRNAGGFGDAIEWDIMETFSDGWGPTVWDWSINSQYGVSTIGTNYSPFDKAWNAQGNVKSGPFDGTRRVIGALWVPATATTQGRIQYYLNGTLIPGMTNRWNLWNSSVGLPLVNGSTSDSIMDFQHFTMLAGTGAENPMTIYSISIWQKDGSKNLPPTTVTPPTGGPGPGPPFQNLTSFLDMGNGQKGSTGLTSNFPGIAAHGFSEIAIKPYEVNGVWRNGETGNFYSPGTASFIDRGVYLYTPDVASIFSATGCPAVNPGINPVSGIRGHVRWFTAGPGMTAPIQWGLYFEPGMTTDGHGDLYAVIVDFSRPRGDTFHSSGAAGQSDLVKGLGVFRTTSWGSIWDLTGVSTGVPGYGLGWVAFIGVTMTMNDVIADW